MKLDKTEQHILLEDNRKLSFAEYGSSEGYPIVYCHGSQSSRLEMHYDMDFASKHNLRIITIDRPGHGFSDFNPSGTVLSFGEDVMQLMNQLNITTFSVAGMSAGAPFALGLAYLYSNNVANVAIISGFAPYSTESKKYLSKEVKTMLNLAKSFPFLLKLLLKIQVKQLEKTPKKALSSFLKIMSKPDQKVLKNESVMQIIETMFIEAFRNGSKGVAHEISKVLVRDWGFALNEIKVPVYFWQGEKDNNVPHEWAILMRKKIPQATLKLYSAEGHLIIFKHAEEMFSSLKPAFSTKI